METPLTVSQQMTENLLTALAESTRARAPRLKNLTELTKDLRTYAMAYIFEDGALVDDLLAAANYLEAIANRD